MLFVLLIWKSISTHGGRTGVEPGDNNVGWRLDYQVVTPGLKDKVIRTDIYKTERFSDHAPLTMDYEW